MRLKDLAKSTLLALGIDVRFAARYDSRTMQKRLFDGLEVKSVVDAGAFQGVLTAFYREAFPNAEIYAFEPFPESAAIFRARHDRDFRVHLIPAALGEAPGTHTFHVTTNLQHNSLLPVDQAAWSVGALAADHEVRTLTVPVETLDAFCNKQGVAHIDLLKMDLQGAEFLALRGAREMLGRGAIDVIYTEVVTVPHYEGQCYFHEVTAELHTHGFQLFGIYNIGLSDANQMTTADAIYIGPAVQKRLADRRKLPTRGSGNGAP